MIESLNPTTGAKLATYDTLPREQVLDQLAASRAAYFTWRGTSIVDRQVPMRRAAAILRERADEFARLMSDEMGKTIREGPGEIEKCAWVCEYYADHAEEFLARETVEAGGSRSFVTFNPLGVVLAIMPWNFPFWQVFRFAAPAVMAGNTALLKHSSNVPGCALAIEDVFRQAGFPEHVFRTLLMKTSMTADVIRDPRVAAVTLTGSTAAGQAVAAEAGGALKKTVLELGGNDAYLILEDADLEQSVEVCVTSRLINAGQSCIAAKRFLVVEPVFEEFQNRFVDRMRSVRMGDPLAEDTDIGPQARHDLRDELHDQVLRSVQQGARLLLGGSIPDGPGAFYPPTVLTEVKKGMPAYDEELFGPVASIIAVRDEEEAIHVANDSIFGLGGAVFTRDVARGERIASERIEAGACFVNSFVKSDPRLPFGGVKQSGYGRELSRYGIREFVNIKTVYVA